MKATIKRTFSNRRRVTAAAVAAAALLGTVGATAAFADGSDDGGRDVSSSVRLSENRELDDTAKDLALVKAAKIGESEAASAASKAVPGTVTSAELDDADRDGSVIWEVDVLGKDGKNHDVTVDAGNGEVLRQHVDSDDDTAQDRALVKADRIGQDGATHQALQAVPGTVTSVELDDRDSGSVVWGIDVLGKDRKSHDVTVDAGSGKVLNQHVDHDDHGDNGDGNSDDDGDDS
ncbi:PepSY domain-containing protein [Streptomyces sp. NPDC088400]|uniref:PepSY domain-containing protein n=1 Tax=Streptomyces sp. NPDC088400 TaxID=3365861 RepID=UPI0038040291